MYVIVLHSSSGALPKVYGPFDNRVVATEFLDEMDGSFGGHDVGSICSLRPPIRYARMKGDA